MRMRISSGLFLTAIIVAALPAYADPPLLVIPMSDSPSADLALAMSVDDAFPDEGDTVSFTITLTNLGPDDATGILVRDLLPAGLTYVADLPTQGTYDSGSGAWVVGSVLASGGAGLKIVATVNPGTGGSTLENTATITASDLPDPVSGNDTAQASVSVRSPRPMQLTTGSYVGDGVDGRAITGLGFEPDFVIVKSAGANEAVCRTSTMSGDVSKHLGSQSILSGNRIQSLDADGFSVGDDADANQSGVTYYWTAFQAGSGQMDLGTYIGNGMDDREITGLGFTPILVIVLGEGAHYAWHRSSTMLSGQSLVFAGMDVGTNRIQELTADGFQIGSHAQVNSLGTKYHYVAWTEIPGRAGNGSYVGDGTDDREIKELGFQPDFVFIKEAGPSPALHRPSSLAGDTAQFFAAYANAADNIQALQPDGFQIGSSWFVNDFLYTYHWSAFSASPVTDLAIGKTVSDSLVNEGDTITFTVELRNAGPDDATGIRVVDLLPAGVTYASDNPSQGSYDDVTGRWDAGALLAGGSATLDIDVTVDTHTAGSRITNAAGVTAVDQTDPTSSNDVDSVSVIVEAADLRVAKEVDDPTPDEGDTIQYTITLANSGPDDATGIELTDVLPAGVTYVSDTPSQGVYDDGAGLWTVGAIAAADSATLDLFATIDVGSAGSTITNIASVTAADQGDPVAANNADSVAVTVRGADLAVSKTVDNPFPNVGATIQYTVTVTNLGADDATGVELTDALPAGVTYVSDTPSQGSYDDATGLWTIGAIAVADTATLDLFATIDTGTAGTTITNIASITASDPSDPVAANDTDSVSVTIPAIDLAVTKEVDDPTPSEGDTVQYTITLTNLGPANGTGIRVTDLLPAGVTFVSATPSVGGYVPTSGMWTLGTLLSGNTATLDIRATVDAGTAGQTITNTATITAVNQEDPNSSNDSDSADIVVQSADLAVAKTVDDPTPAEGDPLIYTVTITNAGPNDATGVELTDLLPGGVTYVSDAPSQGSYASGTGIWSVGAIAAADSATLELFATVDVGAAGATITNVASITAADQGDPAGGNNADSVDVTVAGADLAVTKVVDNPTPHENDPITYTITVTNAGPGDATGVELTDLLPTGVTYVSDAPSQGSYTSGTGLWNIGGIAIGDSATLDISATVDVGTLGLVITNAATLTAATPADPDPSNNSDSTDIAVQGTDLEIEKSVDDESPAEGGTIQYTLTVRNNGPGAASGVEVTDLLPAGVTYVSDAPSQGSYASGTGLWTVGAVAVADSAMLMITATVDPGTAGSTIVNTAEITAADQPDPESGNNTDDASIQVEAADLEIAKTVDDPTPNEGDSITYTVTVTNLGPDDATGVEVTDLLPAGVTYAGDTPSQGSYDDATGVWTVGAITAADSATLALAATVDVGTAGSTITNTASVTGLDQIDPVAANDADSVAVIVQSADLEIEKGVDNATPNESDPVAYTVTVRNLGPHAATGVEVTDLLPAGVVYASDTPSQGSYVSATGLWTVGAIAAADSATLAIGVTVALGTAGSTITNLATATALDQTDPVSGNDADSVAITVQGADLALAKTTDNPAPNEGESFTYTVTVTNLGPDAASGVEVTDLLPAGVTYASDTPSQGSYESATGLWTVGSIAAADSATLAIAATVDPGTAGATITNSASVTAADQGDPVSANNADSVAIVVPSVDLEMAKAVSDSTPDEGDSIVYSVTVRNLGPDGATGVEITDVLPAGVTYAGDTPSQGSYESATGLWTAGAVAAGDSATLGIAAIVDAGTGGSTIVNTATITSADQTDTNSTNDADSVAIDVPVSVGQVTVVAYPQSGATLRPGAAAVEVLRLGLANRGLRADTLATLTLTNTTAGPGTQEELDAEWRPLELSFQLLGVAGTGGPGFVTVPLKQAFSGGVATFTNLNVEIAPGDTLLLVLTSGASTAARDGDTLDLMVADASDLGFMGTVILSGDLPVDPAGGFPVDGMTAAQIRLEETATASLLAGSTRNVVLRAIVPANGYSPDVLQRVDITNRGTAVAGVDLERLEIWADADRDSVFAAAADSLLGEFVFTGSRWEITGLSHAVPTSGVRLFITCDVAELATAGRTLVLALPTAPDVGIGMASNNDGPIDREVENVSHQTISTVNRVILAANPIAPGIAAPGAEDRLLLHLVATNTYSVPQTLTSLTLANATSGSGTTPQLDAECEFVYLREDGDDDGGFDANNDPALATAFFSTGEASFSGFSWTLAAGETRHLFVSADVSLLGATDGDVIRGNAAGPAALGFAGGDVSTAASWPLDSQAAWTVDGMVAAQITNFGAPVATLGPNEGPALALDLRIPRNGYADDVLRGVTLTNRGTATSSDIAKVRLWRDGGDGVFDAGVGDDTDLGPTTYMDGDWTSALLSVPVSAGGVRLFASVTSSLAPTDSATVQLAVVTDGITMDSGNDGPYDGQVENPNALLLSTAALLATLELDPAASTIGQNVTALLHVRNVGSELITQVAPSALEATGDGTLSLLSGPTPSDFDLAAGAESTFVWSCQADSAGTVYFAASASGIEESSGLTRQSLTTTSNPHTIFLQAQDLELFPVESMPFSITRGQTEVVPLSLTFANSGDSTASAVRLLGLKIRLEDESGAGIIPADLLSRVVVNEGANVYLEKTSLETSGAEIDLTLAQPAVIESQGLGGGQVTLSLSFDISDSTGVPNFRLAITDSTWFAAEDATNGAPVNVSLQQGGYPIQSGLARIVAEATELQVSCPVPTPRSAGQGQPNVPLLDVEFLNYDEQSLAADVRLSGFSVTLTDSTGQPLSEPATYLEKIRVRTAVQELLERPVTAADDSSLALLLSPLLSLPVNAPVPVSITADLADTAPLGAICLRLSDSTSFDARDANTGKPVAVVYASDPIAGGLVTIEAPADTILARAVGGIEPWVMVGESDVTALAIEVVHPGGAGAGRARCDSLTIQLRDAQHVPLVPAEYLSRLAVLRNSIEVGVLSDMPTKDEGATIALTGTYFDPADTTTLTVCFDLRATSPTSFLELLVSGTGFHVFDDNLGLPVAVQPATGAEFPLGSGLTQLMAPARELATGFESLLPKVLASDGPTVSAARLRLENVADPTSSVIRVERLELRVADRDFNELVAGEVVAQVQAFIGQELWAESGPLTETEPTAVVTAATPLVLSPGEPVEVEVVAMLRASPKTQSLRIGCRASGIGVIQPDNPLLAVTVQPEEGQSFPFWSNAAGFAPSSLAESYSNFPNPFAAGRSETRFVFNLPAPGRVTLRVWTARGKSVGTILDAVSLSAGLYQDTTWDGRNGRGETVVNGVYVVELTVDFADGSHERLLRKVAVVR
jgi:uncharacterized repeat protein (TIGR01451 family)